MRVAVVLIHWPTPEESKPYATDVLGVYRTPTAALAAGAAWKADKAKSDEGDECWWSMITTSIKD